MRMERYNIRYDFVANKLTRARICRILYYKIRIYTYV